MGCKNESAGNQTTTITFNETTFLFDCRVRLLNDKNNKNTNINNNSKYFYIKNIDFGQKHNEILKQYLINQKKLNAPIHIRFLKDKEKKHNKDIYRFYFSLDNEVVKNIKDKNFNYFIKFKKLITNNIKNNYYQHTNLVYLNSYFNKGIIGVDINEKHISASIIDKAGKLINSFDLYYYNFINIDKNNLSKDIKEKFNFAANNNSNLFNSNTSNNFNTNKITRNKNKNFQFSSTQKEFVLGNIVKVLIELAKKHNCSIAIEKLDFAQKKRLINLNNKIYKSYNKRTKRYNNMLNSFSYSLFKTYLLSRAFEEEIEVLHINPMYTSFIGLINYAKPLGLSIHQSAALTIAKRAELYLKNNVPMNLKAKYQPILENFVFSKKTNNVYELKFNHQSKVASLNYVANNSLPKKTVDKSSKELQDNLSVWSEIYTLYKSYKENLYKNKKISI